MSLQLTYAKTFYRKNSACKLHYTKEGKWTLCGLSCYPGSNQQHPWQEVCNHCRKIVLKAVPKESKESAP